MWRPRVPFILPLLLALICGWSFAENSSTSKSAKQDYSDQAVVVEALSNKLVFENNGTGTREQHARVQVQSDAGVKKFGLLVFRYASSVESVEIVYVRVHKADGSTVETPDENIQDITSDITRAAPFYSDLREKHVAVKGLGTGDTLEYLVRWKVNKALAPGEFWSAYNFDDTEIELKEELQISVPRDRAVKWSSPKVKPVITEDAEYKVFTWTTSNLKTKTDDEQDHSKEVATGTSPGPDVEFSSFQSWNQVAQWYESLQQDRVKPSPAVAAKAAELTKGVTDENAKIEKLYHYVSTQVRYIGIAFGIGRYQPHSADDILANEYGDCKDKHTLLAAMLQSVGITAYPALINSSHSVDQEVPSPGQFDHVITAVPQGKGFLWLDSTAEVGPFGYLVPPLRNKPALVVTENATSAFVNTIAEPPFPSFQKFQITGTLSDAGVLDAKVGYSLRGDVGLVFRVVFRTVPESNWKELVQNVVYRLGFGGTVSDVSASAPDDTSSPFQFHYSYTRNNYSDWDNKRISPPFPVLTLPGLKDDQTKFTAPLWLGTPNEQDFEAQIQMPAKYPIQHLPSGVDVVRDFAEYHSLYKNDNGKLIAERRLIIKLEAVPVNEFAEYKSFRKQVDDDLNETANLASPQGSTNQNASNSVPVNPQITAMQKIIGDLAGSSNPEATRLMNQGEQALRQRDLATAIASLKAAVAADPAFTRAWYQLAGLLMFSKQPDAAVDALNSAIAVDPKQVAPYKAAAFMLMGDREPGKAIPILQQLVKLAPDDHDAIDNLAVANLQAKHYADAIIAYQSAIKLDAKNGGLQAGLGDAYLLNGDSDNALTAYKAALQLNSAPGMLNNIAYEMAEANKEIPQALDWAQKAVQQEEEATAKVDLSSLKNEDLIHPNTLSAYWDTLAWVYFRMKNFTEAEKYAHAAWLLTQDPTVADHLGQIYEAAHKDKDAVHFYKIALSWDLEHAVPESATKDLRDRLDHISPGASKISLTDPVANAASSAEGEVRTVKLSHITSQTASAEFFLIFSQDKNSSPRVSQVKFISGSDDLKSAAKALTAAHYSVLFPDNGPTRLVRRGILGCYQYTGCSFVLYPPAMVRSVN